MSCECLHGWAGMAADGPVFCACHEGLSESVKWWTKRVRQHQKTLAAIEARYPNRSLGWQAKWRFSESRALVYAERKRDEFCAKLDHLRETALPVQHKTGQAVLFKT